MLLGDRAHFSRDHYEARSGLAPSHLCELVVHCLEVVGQLAHRGLDFRFKGGNSLLVLLSDPQRFSIDVDIVTTESKERLHELVEAIVTECPPFTRWEARSPRTKPWLPMISFKLHFDSVYRPEEDAYVMLDCVLEPAPYPGERRVVRCGDIYRSEVEVEVPSVSGLIGDKLLTLGPATLGIPLGKNKEAHRLKHVFDLSLLSRQGYDPVAVRASVDGCMAQENRIQGSDHGFDAVMEDTILFLRAPLDHAEPPPLSEIAEGSYLYETVKGFEDFRQHLFRVDYRWPMFQDDCRRVLQILTQLRDPRN
jgi:hypothetical protein